MDDLNDIKARLFAVQSGPWEWWQGCLVQRRCGKGVVLSGGREPLRVNVNGVMRPIQDGHEAHPTAAFLQNAPEDMSRLFAEIGRLHLIIRAAREDFRMPADPECPHCEGSGEYLGSPLCPCSDVMSVAMARAHKAVERERARREEFKTAHGHEEGAPCNAACPPVELPF